MGYTSYTGECRMFILSPQMTVKDISLIIALTALCVSSSYMLIELPNIYIVDLVVFVTGFVFGASIGVITGFLSWFVYGIINPFGFVLPIWISTIIGETFFGLVGGLLGRLLYVNISEKSGKTSRFSIEMALWGGILTIIYDLFTNIVYAYTFQVPVIAAIVSGWLIPPFFGILHELSNFVLFFFAVYPLATTITTLRGGEIREST